MNTQRLKKMVELLNRIDHTIQAGYLDHSAFDLAVWKRNSKEYGTASCAVGYACQDAWFNAEGLELMTHGLSSYPVYRDGEVERWGWNAVGRFFGLSEYESYHLFAADEYGEGRFTLPGTVAARISGFINKDLD